LNAITDVAGVEVGFATLIEGLGPRVVGQGPVRTGVTVILPRGLHGATDPVWAGMFALNGNGELTGSHWIAEAGTFEGPIALTNTHSVGTVHEALARWITARARGAGNPYSWCMPVVSETCDAWLNDIDGFHVRAAHVLEALQGARPGAVAEGNVGGGTGMIAFEWKGGTGTASRSIELLGARYTVGVLVQANFGRRPDLSVLGVPVGRHLDQDRIATFWQPPTTEQGSVVGVLATDAPLQPIQLQRVARRMALGMARTGGFGADGSGDLFLAFSVANPGYQPHGRGLAEFQFLPGGRLDPLVLAAVEATEEAIVNSLLAAETMQGADDHRVVAIDHQELLELLTRYGRTPDPADTGE
jgi:D-aminopeptidase